MTVLISRVGEVISIATARWRLAAGAVGNMEKKSSQQMNRQMTLVSE